MSGFTLTIDEAPDPESRKAILAPLRKHNAQWLGEPVVQPLAIFLRDPQSDAVIGGLWGQSVVGWLFVDLLFVPQHLRRQGLGARLLRDAEEVAIKRGDIGVWLSTGDFQAPGFYEKLGYQRFGHHADYPKGHATYYYCKRMGS